MSDTISVGSRVNVRIGMHTLTCTVLDLLPDNVFQVRNESTGHIFSVGIQNVLGPGVSWAEEATESASSTEAAPADDSAAKGKKLSLAQIAYKVLEEEAQPMTVTEILRRAREEGIYDPSNYGKTPEQTLYSALVRENKIKEHPRVKHSALLGKWEFQTMS